MFAQVTEAATTTELSQNCAPSAAIDPKNPRGAEMRVEQLRAGYAASPALRKVLADKLFPSRTRLPAKIPPTCSLQH